MNDQKINVGVIGYGLSAKVFHIPLILSTPSLTLHTIVQRSPTPSNSATADHPNVRIVSSVDALFADPSIHLVVLTTTPESHYALCVSALQALKHVLVEKPFVPTAIEADSLVDLAKKQKRFLCVYQNRRWDTDFLTVRKVLQEGTLGRIVEFETHFDRYKPLRPETWKGTLSMQQAGGVLYDLGTHLLDQVVYAFGMPVSVTALFTNQRADGGDEPDSISAILAYKDGMLATAKAGVMSIDSEQLRFWIRGSKGSFKKYHLDIQEDQLRAGMRPTDEGFGVEGSDRSGTLTVLDENGKAVSKTLQNVHPETYAALYEGFADAIIRHDEATVPVKASEARDVLKVIEAARESATTKKTVEL